MGQVAGGPGLAYSPTICVSGVGQALAFARRGGMDRGGQDAAPPLGSGSGAGMTEVSGAGMTVRWEKGLLGRGVSTISPRE